MKNIKIKVAAASHRGRRKWNEDNFYTGKRISVDAEGLYSLSHTISKPTICAVCDGMGGLTDGKVASQNVVTYLKEYCNKNLYHNSKKSFHTDSKKNIFVWINQLVNELNGYMNMAYDSSKEYGSTLAMLYLGEEKIYASNIGDSSIYIFKKGILEKISIDHTQHASAVRLGIKSKDDTWGKNVLTQYLGMPIDSIVLEPYTISVDYDPMTFLMCSDGLIERLNEQEISHIVSNAKYMTLKSLSKKLIKAAIDKGTKDNVTVMLVRIRI